MGWDSMEWWGMIEYGRNITCTNAGQLVGTKTNLLES